MQETEIAAKVAQNIPKPTPPTAPEPDVPQKNDVEEDKGYVPSLDDTQLNKYLTDYFDVTGNRVYDDQTQAQIRLIQQWAYDTAGTTDHVKAMQAIQSLESELGAVYRKDRLERLAKFIRLKQQSQILSMQMEAVKGSV